MNLEINAVKSAIRHSVKKNIGVSVEDDEKSLLSTDYKAIIADFLYVLQDLENEYGSCIYEIFANNTYTVFTVSNFAEAIVKTVSKQSAEGQNASSPSETDDI